jgi:hypothetical protein
VSEVRWWCISQENTPIGTWPPGASRVSLWAMSKSETVCVSIICLALLLPAAAGASSTRGEPDLSVIERHQALGRLQPPPDRDSWLGDVRVTVDRTALRRHRALGLLPDNLAAGASTGEVRAENNAFDWRDGAIGFGVGAAAVGLAIALATRAWRRTAAALPNASR